MTPILSKTTKSLLVISILMVAGCASTQDAPDSSIQAVSDACAFGAVHSYQSVGQREKVAFVCK